MSNKRFVLLLLLVLAVAGAVRLPGVFWLSDITPDERISPHPDESRFLRSAERFQERKVYRGYVLGIVTHLFLLEKTADRLFDDPPRPVVLLRLVSWFYGVATVGLLAYAVRALGGGAGTALVAALLFALAPLPIINSHFGTADTAALFYLAAAALAAHRYAVRRTGGSWLLFSIAAGFAIGVKFYLTLLVPFALLLVTDRRKVYRATTACFVIVGSFGVMNFFRYSPFDLVRLIDMIAHDNLDIPGTPGLGRMIYDYSRSFVPSLGIPTFLLALVGTAIAFRRGARGLRRNGADPRRPALRRLLAHPMVVLLSPFAAHVFLVSRVGLIAPRHLLPVTLLASVAAAFGARAIGRRLPRPAALLAGAAVLVYLAGNAIGTERLYTDDVRRDAALWIEKNVPPGEPVTTFLDWSRVGNVRRIEGAAARESRIESDWFVTYDIEFRRYFRADSADEIFHAFGGARRLRLFRDLLAGRTEFEPAAEFREHAFTPEQRLIRLGVLRHIETFTAKRYIIYRRRGRTSSPLAPSPAP